MNDPNQMKALLPHCEGMDPEDIYFTSPEAPEPEEGEYVLRQQDQHFRPQVNVPY